jgi:hypothetical protein
MIYKRFDQPDWIILDVVIFQTFGKQSGLAAVFAFNKTLHGTLRRINDRIISCFVHVGSFYTAWGVSETLCMVLSPRGWNGSFVEPLRVEDSELVSCGNPFSDAASGLIEISDGQID